MVLCSDHAQSAQLRLMEKSPDYSLLRLFTVGFHICAHQFVFMNLTRVLSSVNSHLIRNQPRDCENWLKKCWLWKMIVQSEKSKITKNHLEKKTPYFISNEVSSFYLSVSVAVLLILIADNPCDFSSGSLGGTIATKSRCSLWTGSKHSGASVVTEQPNKFTYWNVHFTLRVM